MSKSCGQLDYIVSSNPARIYSETLSKTNKNPTIPTPGTCSNTCVYTHIHKIKQARSFLFQHRFFPNNI